MIQRKKWNVHHVKKFSLVFYWTKSKWFIFMKKKKHFSSVWWNSFSSLSAEKEFAYCACNKATCNKITNHFEFSKKNFILISVKIINLIKTKQFEENITVNLFSKIKYICLSKTFGWYNKHSNREWDEERPKCKDIRQIGVTNALSTRNMYVCDFERVMRANLIALITHRYLPKFF